MRIVLETYKFLYSKQDNKWYSLKEFNFLNMTNKLGWKGAQFMRFHIYFQVFACMWLSEFKG